MPELLLTSTNRKLSSSTLPLVHKLHGLTCPSMISHMATSVAQSRLRTRSLSAIGKPSLSSRSKIPPLYEIVLVLNMLWSLLGLGLTWRLELKGSSSLHLLLMLPYLWCSRPQHSFHSRTMRIMKTFSRLSSMPPAPPIPLPPEPKSSRMTLTLWMNNNQSIPSLTLKTVDAQSGKLA